MERFGSGSRSVARPHNPPLLSVGVGIHISYAYDRDIDNHLDTFVRKHIVFYTYNDGVTHVRAAVTGGCRGGGGGAGGPGTSRASSPPPWAERDREGDRF